MQKKEKKRRDFLGKLNAVSFGPNGFVGNPLFRLNGRYFRLKLNNWTWVDDCGANENVPILEMSAMALPADINPPTDWTTPPLMVERVVFNDPATVVLWSDGTKTVVKAHDEAFDPEKGLAMAISKRFLKDRNLNPRRFFREAADQILDTALR